MQINRSDEADVQLMLEAILLGGSRYDDALDALDEFETFDGYSGMDTYFEVDIVSQALSEAIDGFAHGWSSDTEGVIGMYEVSHYLGHDFGMYLTYYGDIKYLRGGDGEAVGMDAAMRYATVLFDDYQRVLAKARQIEGN